MDIDTYVESRRQMVNESLTKFVNARYSDEMMRVAAYIAMGGKRLRGVLTCLVCESLGGKPEEAMVGAVACEMIQAASLSHDDIMDGDTTRRGQPSTWASQGILKAIMVPHVMVPHAALFISQYGLRAMLSVIEHWSRISTGQALDMPELHHLGVTPGTIDQYDLIISGKTGAGFEIAAELGARAVKQDWLIKPTQVYGMAIGMAFQVADDACDLLENIDRPWDTLGKNGKVAVSLMALKAKLASGEMITTQDADMAWAWAMDWVGRAQETATLLASEGEFALLLQDYPLATIRALRAETEARIKARAESTVQAGG